MALKTDRRIAKKGSVLIVDDEEIMREVLETLLSTEGYRVDLGKICHDLLIAAALTGDRTEATAREPLRRTCAAEMNYRGELLRLPAGRSFWPVREDCRSVAVQKHRRQLDGAARWDPRIETA